MYGTNTRHFYEGCLSPLFIRNGLDVEFESEERGPIVMWQGGVSDISFILISYVIRYF